MSRISRRVIQAAGHLAPAPRRAHLTRPTLVLCTTVLALAMSASPSALPTTRDFLSANVDPAVSPRVDFFQHAGGGWLRRNPIPESQASWGVWNVASNEIYARLRKISENAAASKATRGSAQQLIGDMWATGMDTRTINRQGLLPLKGDLARIDAIRSVRDFLDVVAALHRRNMFPDNFFVQQRILFQDGVDRDQIDSNRRIYYLSQGGLTMGRLAYSATDPPRVKIQNAFREYLFRTFLRLHRDSDKARASAAAVYDLETKLAAGFEQGAQSRRTQPADLVQLTPTLDWNRYFEQIGVTGIESVQVRHPEFLKSLDVLLRTESLEAWKDYLRFWLVKVNAPFLDDETFGEFFAYKSVVTGQQEPEPRWRRVLWQEKNWLGLPLAKLYVEAKVPPATRTRLRAVAESIRQAFRERVGHLDWMSDSTKDSARRKLDRLKITIGYPEKWIDFSTMPLRRDSYLLNMIRTAEWFHDWEVNSLNRAVDKGEVELHPRIGGDAEYIDSNNEVRVPDLVPPPGVREQQLDDAFLYGSTMLGHEIAHALDSEGRHYDADGNRADWWTPVDTAAFEQRAQALVNQYNEFAPIQGMHVDGKRTLRENMADMVGIRIALDAFKKTKQFRKNERVGGLTPLQRFFVAYAYSRTGHERPESLMAKLRGGGYAPMRERVNGVVVNIPEFYEAFDVRKGDPMYRSEGSRVRVW